MTTIRFLPELMNPPHEGSIGFSYIDKAGQPFQTLTLEQGTNRKVSKEAWDILKAHPSVASLVKIGAIEELLPKTVAADAAAVTAAELAEMSDVLSLSLQSALKVADDSKDEDFLVTWRKVEKRESVINRINLRLTSIANGNL